MKAQLVWQPERDAYALYLTRESIAGREIARFQDGEIVMERIDTDRPIIIQPTLIIQGPVWQMLKDAILGVETGQAPDAHLQDAITVRDRLLVLVEGLTERYFTTPRED